MRRGELIAMRVAIVLNFPPDDHRLVYARGLAKELVRKGHYVTLFLQKGDQSKKEDETAPYAVVALTGSTYSLWGQLRFMWGLFQYLKRRRWDVIHGRNPFSSVLPSLLLRRLGVTDAPIVYDVRGLWIDFGYRDKRFGNLLYQLLRMTEGVVMRNADRIIAISDRLKRILIRRGVESDKIDIVFGDGVDTRELSARPRHRRSESKVVGYVGSLTRARRPHLLIESFQIAQSQSEVPLELILVGPGNGEEPRLKDQAAALGLESSVTVTGPLSHSDALSQMSKFSVALSYDATDWLPFQVAVHTKVFEYMAFGLPIVATRHPVHEGVLVDGANAIITEPNPVSFAKGILRVVSDESLCKKLGANAKRDALKHDIREKATEVEETYRRAGSR